MLFRKTGKRLIFGLGNPGPDYADTLHNVGFKAVDIIAREQGLAERNRRNARVFDLKEHNALLIKPQTFMNLSGKCVLDFAHFYKAAPQDIIVIYDDIDLPLGSVRVRGAGGAGTHNGMRDIIKHIATEDFPRVRVGIGPKPEKWDLVDYVLSVPKGEDAKLLQAACENAAGAAMAILKDGVDKAQSAFNKRR